jgi:hypothetical protein
MSEKVTHLTGLRSERWFRGGDFGKGDFGKGDFGKGDFGI